MFPSSSSAFLVADNAEGSITLVLVTVARQPNVITFVLALGPRSTSPV